MLVPLLVLLKIPQNVKAANFRLRINGSWFLLKRRPRFMLSELHTNRRGRTSLVSGVPEKASVLIQFHLVQAGHPKATLCQRGLEWGFHIKGGQRRVCFLCKGVGGRGLARTMAELQRSPGLELHTRAERGEASASPQALAILQTI